MKSPLVQLLLEGSDIPPWVSTALESIKASCRLGRLDRALGAPADEGLTARIVVADTPNFAKSRRMERVRQWCATDPFTTLVLIPDSGIHELGGLGAVEGVTRSGPLSPFELAQRLSTICTSTLGESGRDASVAHATTATEERRDRTQNEQLAMAWMLQQRLLSRSSPTSPDAAIRTFFQPYAKVSGDWYDIRRLTDHQLGICVIDVVGHGLPAALMTLHLSHAIDQALGMEDGVIVMHPVTPDGFLTRLNEQILNTPLTEMCYVAAGYVVYDEHAREAKIARAGLPYPILFRAAGGAMRVESDGALIGAMDEREYEVVSIMLGQGDALAIYTDGVPDRIPQELAAMSAESALSRDPGSSPCPHHAPGIDLLFGHMHQLAASGALADDATIVAIEAC